MRIAEVRCDRCGKVVSGRALPPDGWLWLDFEDGVDLCPSCVEEFRKLFMKNLMFVAPSPPASFIPHLPFDGEVT